jgi:hypothetical protein
MIKKRKNNFLYLAKNINNDKIAPLITYQKGECPMFYPIFTEHRDYFRQYLLKNNIYCPIHWNTVYNHGSDSYEEWKRQNNVLSVIIDQRYDIEDMEYIAKIINKY